jgi:hypothetical protein
MPKLVLTNPRVILDGFDISDHCASISFGTVYDLVEVTQIGDIAKKRVAGLEDNTLSLELQQDFSVSQVESVIYPNRGLRVNCSVRPVNAARSATNPQYDFSVLISEWTPLSGSVGGLATINVNWPIYGEIIKTTTP